MSREASLRGRVITGAVLWTFGLLLVASALLAAIVDSHASGARVVHGALGHTAIVLTVSVTCLVIGAWQVRTGLASVQRLRERLVSVQKGGASRVDGAYPAEIQPLVDELNALIQDHERRVQRAQAKAGDLAHGLKTPLAILTQEAERARRDGFTDLGSALEDQIVRMRRQIEYHLAHARAAASGAGLAARRSQVHAAASALAQTLTRIYADRQLSLDLQCAAEHTVRCEREDLEEMLGNLMDNACKWARSRIVVSSREEGPLIVVTVEDDGPGLDPAVRSEALQRGVRLDERVDGAGLGLAIARDLAELYRGSLSLDRAAAGGLAARLSLPSASSA